MKAMALKLVQQNGLLTTFNVALYGRYVRNNKNDKNGTVITITVTIKKYQHQYINFHA